MRKRLAFCCITILSVLVIGCAQPGGDTIAQVSTIDALLAGIYDGHMACGELMRHGDLGIGTFDKLDGEMALIDGALYQVRADGKVYYPDAKTTTPFAAVCRFAPEQSVRIAKPTNYDALQKLLDSKCPDKNGFYAFKAHGTFSRMKTRSVPAQKKPYPPLAQVTKTQPVFEMKKVSGTIVGFRCPPYVKGINVPGYHLHFISDDKTQGGHILDFEMASGTCQIDRCRRFLLILPQGDDALANVDLTKDRAKELEKVEK